MSSNNNTSFGITGSNPHNNHSHSHNHTIHQNNNNNNTNIGNSTNTGSSGSAVREYLQRTVGIIPKDSYGWLYACRGLYSLKEYSLVIEGLQYCIRHEHTRAESTHLLAFSLLHSKENKQSALAFQESIKLGNDTDWQPLVELACEQPKLIFNT